MKVSLIAGTVITQRRYSGGKNILFANLFDANQGIFPRLKAVSHDVSRNSFLKCYLAKRGPKVFLK